MKRGPLWEAQIVDYLREHGFPYAERRVMGGTDDRGDIAGCPGLVLEAKSCRRMELAAWIDQVTEAAERVDAVGTADYGDGYQPVIAAVIHKRIGRGDPGEGYVTMKLSTFVELVR